MKLTTVVFLGAALLAPVPSWAQAVPPAVASPLPTLSPAEQAVNRAWAPFDKLGEAVTRLKDALQAMGQEKQEMLQKLAQREGDWGSYYQAREAQWLAYSEPLWKPPVKKSEASK